MGNDKVVSLAAPAVVEDALTELLRTGARRLIEAAVAAEFEECLSGFADERLPDGRRRVVRNGHLPRREIVTGIGAVEVEVPKLRSRSGSSAPFRSSLVPPYVRRSASLDAAVPWLYLHGVSTGSDARGGVGAGGRGSGSRAVGERGEPAQAQLGRGVPVVVPAEPCRRLGIRLGGRHPQRPAGRGRTAVRTGGDWRERPRREALPGDRGRCSGVHAELARGVAGDEAARLRAAGEAGCRRRRAGLLVGAVGGVSADPGAALLDAQDRQRPQLSAEVEPAEGQAGPP